MESEKAAIVFNGEIYNYKVLRQELKVANYQFKSESDTEVLLHGYSEWGIKTLMKKVEGMIALAIYDKNTKQLHLCRDIFGKKPLYYIFNEKILAFSSDIKALKIVQGHSEIDYESLDYYLSELTVPQPKTIWKDIKQVERAHYMTFDLADQKVSQLCYWEIERSNNLISEEEALQEVEQLLIKAIQKRQMGDVGIGYFLSSGADSGLIVALSALNSQSPIHTYTMGFDYSDNDETKDATQLADKYQTTHNNITITPDIVDIVPKLIDYMGEPFADSSMIPTYYIAEAMSKDFKVAISGDGGDECFGGYYEYSWAYQLDEFISRYPNKSRRNTITGLDKLKQKLVGRSKQYGHLNNYNKWTGAQKLHRKMGFDLLSKHQLYNREFKNARPEYTASYLQSIWG